MPEEDKDKQEEANAGEGVPAYLNEEYGDDALDRAAEPAAPEEDRQEEPAPDAGEKGEETPPAEEEKEEKADESADQSEEPPPQEEDEAAKEEHKERTKLGRKVAKLEEKIDSLMERLAERASQPAPSPQAEAEEPEVITTTEDLDRYLAKREQKLQQAKQQETLQYQTGYLSQIKGWTEKAEEDGDLDAGELYKLLTDEKSPYNVKLSNSPDADFALNLARAQAYHYKEKAKKPAEKKSPLKNEKPKAPMGVGGDTKTEHKPASANITLDKEALEFIRQSGMSEEDARKFLSSPEPLSLKRGR